jgi:hypothetical protein
MILCCCLVVIGLISLLGLVIYFVYRKLQKYKGNFRLKEKEKFGKSNKDFNAFTLEL